MKISRFLPFATTVAAVGGILYLSILVLKPFLSVLIISSICAILLNPVYERLFRRLKRASLAAFMTLVLLVIIILAPLFFVVSSVFTEARGLVDLLQNQPSLLPDAQSYITERAHYYSLPFDATTFNIQEQSVGFLKTIVQRAGGTVLYAGSLFLNLFFVLMTTYFFLLQKKRIRLFVSDIKLMSTKNFEMLEKRTIEMVNGVVRGNLIVIAVQTVVGTAGFLTFGLPAPLLLGVLYGLFSILPAVGALLVVVPVAILLFFTQGLMTLLFFIVWFTITNIVIDNVIVPKIIGSQTKLHQLVVMFSIVGGVQQFGLIGIVLGPVIMSLAFVAIDMYRELIKDS